jgi:hypothetical protein
MRLPTSGGKVCQKFGLDANDVQKFDHRGDRLAPILACHSGSHRSYLSRGSACSFQDRSPHSAREYIVNSFDAAMSFIWYAIREA